MPIKMAEADPLEDCVNQITGSIVQKYNGICMDLFLTPADKNEDGSVPSYNHIIYVSLNPSVGGISGINKYPNKCRRLFHEIESDIRDLLAKKLPTFDSEKIKILFLPFE